MGIGWSHKRPEMDPVHHQHSPLSGMLLCTCLLYGRIRSPFGRVAVSYLLTMVIVVLHCYCLLFSVYLFLLLFIVYYLLLLVM